IAISISLTLQGCGFHVRTADLDSLGFSEVSLSCDKTSSWDLCQELERELASHKVTMTKDALFELRVFSIEAKERVFTLNQDATADEYELTRSLKFSLKESASDESQYTNEISARRIYRHSSSELLAKDREQAAITKALDQSLAQEIIRQLTLIRIGN
ncbi:LPS assembly lipoprotein LptE, partial [Oleiphilus sp. HI0079]|uniref:LPS-assembly lipoprotein LptE n=2 Tax=Oleiphilus TaxID=141450 RepID=UPI0018D2778E